MTLDELQEKLYELYEANDCDGEIEVFVSTGDLEYSHLIFDTRLSSENQQEIVIYGAS